MISVDALTAYPMTAPSSRARLQGHRAPLREVGVDLRVRTMLKEGEYGTISGSGSAIPKAAATVRGILRTASARKEADLTLIHRLLSMVPVPWFDPPRRLDAYDFDDALQFGSRGANNSGASALKREEARWRSYVSRARLVIAGNPYLADAARTAGAKRVEVVPSCVDPSAYTLRIHREVETVTVGWIGSASTAPYLSVVVEAMQQLVNGGIPVRLVAVGAGPDEERPWIETRNWSLERQASDLATFDIGVMPLPDDPWTRGKCGYKLLQYFAAGVPAVSSPVGVAAAMTAPERGRTAATITEWQTAITELALDYRVRAELGVASRRYVEESYSYERWAPEFASMLVDLA